MGAIAEHFLADLEQVKPVSFYGHVSSVLGMLVEVKGCNGLLSVGDRCSVITRDHRSIPCEIIGFRQDTALAMPYGSTDGIGQGCRAIIQDARPVVFMHNSWLGRVVNALGEPIDGKGALIQGAHGQPIKAQPLPAYTRRRVGGKVETGIRAINTFLTCCEGQRLGIFAGSGVGKSTLLSMLARYTEADVIVIGLIGERGRELQEFLEDDLGAEGLAKSIVVAATSDESPLMRRQAAYLTMALAEFYRNQGRHVLCLMDSVTRFAMAQREIGLSAGEPPTSKGYTPTVFAELPKLLERAGPGGAGQGSITGLFTVLVEGDDTNEPIADAVRGILDGHIVLDRKIAERGRFPAIDILRSVSRTLPDCNTAAQNHLITRARHLLAAYENMAELIRIGAYRQGSDPKVDEAIRYYQPLEAFLAQAVEDTVPLATGYADLAAILGENDYAEFEQSDSLVEIPA